MFKKKRKGLGRWGSFAFEEWGDKHVPFPHDPKPLRITVTLPDGQHRTWAMSEGDGVGLGPVRVDVVAPSEIAFTVAPE